MNIFIFAFLLLASATAGASSRTPWTSAASLFDGKTWKISKYTRTCSEYRDGVLVKEYDCSLMHIQKDVKRSLYDGEKFVSELHVGSFDKTPRMLAIRTQASDTHIGIVDQSEHILGRYERTTEGGAYVERQVVEEREIIDEHFGDFFVPHNDLVETQWNEDCAQSKRACVLVQQSFEFPYGYEVPDRSCGPIFACLESTFVSQTMKSKLVRNPKNNSYTLTSEIFLHSTRGATSRVSALDTAIRVVTDLEIEE